MSSVEPFHFSELSSCLSEHDLGPELSGAFTAPTTPMVRPRHLRLGDMQPGLLGGLGSPSSGEEVDGLSTSWPSRPAIELLSRSVKRWQSVHASPTLNPAASPAQFKACDFGELSLAADAAGAAFSLGCGRAERPPREGVSGTYFFKRADRAPSVLCVFKPLDEEPPVAAPAASASPACSDCSASPAGRLGGFLPGEGAYKEVVAYLLDHDHFAGVPQTALARCQLPVPEVGGAGGGEEEVQEHFRTKMGAFQVYIPNDGDADDYGHLVLPKEQVKRIAVFDIRALNHDRHGGNLLVSKGEDGRFRLTPIDHGYILPTFLSSCPWPVWMDWPCVKEPLSKAIVDYVEGLSAERDARIVREEHPQISGASLRNMKLATMLLKKGVAQGLTLFEIGKMIFSREEEKSELAKIIEEAMDAGMSRERHLEILESEDHCMVLVGGADSGSSGSSVVEVGRRREMGEGEEAGMGEEEYFCREESPTCMFSYPPEELTEATEDYVLRYAGRLMDAAVAKVAAGRSRGEEAPAQAGGPDETAWRRRMQRSRSMPGFAGLAGNGGGRGGAAARRAMCRTKSLRMPYGSRGICIPMPECAMKSVELDKADEVGRKHSPVSVRDIDWSTREV